MSRGSGYAEHSPAGSDLCAATKLCACCLLTAPVSNSFAHPLTLPAPQAIALPSLAMQVCCGEAASVPRHPHAGVLPGARAAACAVQGSRVPARCYLPPARHSGQRDACAAHLTGQALADLRCLARRALQCRRSPVRCQAGGRVASFMCQAHKLPRHQPKQKCKQGNQSVGQLQ